MQTSIQPEDLARFAEKFRSNPSNRIAMNAVSANGIHASALNRDGIGKNRFAFSIEVDSGTACNQKQSGRCWMFASYNVMRLEIMKKLNLENMELSQTYPLFYDKLENIKRAKSAGLHVCSGGIIGMGETWEDRIDMALTLSELGIASIPINALTPIPGTPLEKNRILTEEEILRTIAIFRFINPRTNIRLAAGRVLMKGTGERAFHFGASATITGNMLTTSGSTIEGDKKMLTEMGRDITPKYAVKGC